MNQHGRPTRAEPLLSARGIFVVQLRSDSDLASRHLQGRIEHVMSGESEPFVCLDEMIHFMARHPLDAASPPQTVAAPVLPPPAASADHQPED